MEYYYLLYLWKLIFIRDTEIEKRRLLNMREMRGSEGGGGMQRGV